MMGRQFWYHLSDRVSWCCDTAAPLRQGDNVVVLCDGKLALVGEVLNRFPNMRRRLRIRYMGGDGKLHVSRMFDRDPDEHFETGVVVGISTVMRGLER